MSDKITDTLVLLGRLLLAALFVAGCVQKLIAPEATQALLEARGLPTILVWPAMAFNGFAAFCLMCGFWLAPVSFALALYCMITSIFHLIPDDPWQMSIFVKNWAIAGGLLVLTAQTVQQSTR